jgi:hypothetical protein
VVQQTLRPKGESDSGQGLKPLLRKAVNLAMPQQGQILWKHDSAGKKPG